MIMPDTKYIFLDIDGTLNTGRSDYLSPEKYGHHFDDVAVQNLRCIIESTGATIVISSSWRYMGISRLRELWQKWKLPGEIHGCTPGVWGDETVFDTRGEEIRQWLVENASEPISYVIIDDMGKTEATEEQRSRWITVDPHCGISESDMKLAIATLNAKNCLGQ